MIQPRNFGTTGITVSALGFGAAQIGDNQITEKEAETLIKHDTRRGYQFDRYGT